MDIVGSNYELIDRTCFLLSHINAVRIFRKRLPVPAGLNAYPLSSDVRRNICCSLIEPQ